MSDNPIMLGDEVRVSTSVYNYLNSTRIVALSGGGHVVLWGASIPGYVPGYFYQSYVSDVLGQRFDAAGNPVGGEFFVNEDLRYACDLGDAAATPDGGFMAVYSSWAPAVSVDQSDIVVARFDADGNRVGSEVRINAGVALGQDKPSVAALAEGGHVVVWQTRVGDSYGPYDVHAQMLDGAGQPVGAEIVVNQTLDGYQELPKVTALDGGGFVVVWGTYAYDADGEGNGQAAMARVYGADGQPVTDEFVMNTTVAGNQQDPQVTALANGGFVAVWETPNVEPSPGWGRGIVAQVYGADGTPVGGEVLVNSQTANEQVDPAVAAAPDGGYAVVWWNYADYGVHLQRFAADGSRAGDEVRADTYDNAYDDWLNYQAAVAFLDDGRLVVSWARATPGSNGAYAIFSQTFAAQTFGTGADNTLAGTREGEWLGGLAGNDDLQGRSGADTLSGGIGNDTLDGGRDADLLDGGAGDDLYIIDTRDDVVVEAADGGTDTVRSGIRLDLAIIGAEVENAELTGTGSRAVAGNGLNNSLTGNEGSNAMAGWEGNDTMAGGGGNDTLNGGRGSDLLQGGTGQDVLIGGGSGDTLDGGEGDDVLQGGAGSDVFVFAGNFGADRITGFTSRGSVEVIDLSGVDTIADFADLVANHLTSNGLGDAMIVAGTNSITLTGVLMGDLVANDFLF